MSAMDGCCVVLWVLCDAHGSFGDRPMPRGYTSPPTRGPWESGGPTKWLLPREPTLPSPWSGLACGPGGWGATDTPLGLPAVLPLGPDQPFLEDEAEAALCTRKGLFRVWSCRLLLSAAVLCTLRTYLPVCSVWRPWSQKHTKLPALQDTEGLALYRACWCLTRCPASVCSSAHTAHPGVAVRESERPKD